MREDMRAWLPLLARRRGMDSSNLIRSLLARELTNEFGPGWIQGHLKGDHEAEALVT